MALLSVLICVGLWQIILEGSSDPDKRRESGREMVEWGNAEAI